MFSCEFREISKNTFPYRTPPVVASAYVITEISSSHTAFLWCYNLRFETAYI